MMKIKSVKYKGNNWLSFQT